MRHFGKKKPDTRSPAPKEPPPLPAEVHATPHVELNLVFNEIEKRLVALFPDVIVGTPLEPGRADIDLIFDGEQGKLFIEEIDDKEHVLREVHLFSATTLERFDAVAALPALLEALKRRQNEEFPTALRDARQFLESLKDPSAP